MDWLHYFGMGSPYGDFLGKYAERVHQDRWQANYEAIALNVDQAERIRSFVRSMKVICLAGAWCGDCASQCPIFRRISEAAATGIVDIRYLDRDDAPAQFAELVRINGGRRVPAVIFLSEDGYEVSRYGEKTLAKYRQESADLQGQSCSLGLATSDQAELRNAVVSEWIDQFERAQLILRLSARLRQKYGD
jgi:hypothetical protein